MEIRNNVELKNYLTMRIGGISQYLAEIKNKEELLEALTFADKNHLRIFILGGGSNTLASDKGFAGLVVVNRMTRSSILKEDDESISICYGSGEVLDDIVLSSVQSGYTGIEAMSHIPGTLGGALVQNSGAYGQEIADVFEYMEVYDLKDHCFKTLYKEDCHFTYRHSIFRGREKGRYIIINAVLRLYKGFPKPPFYKQVQQVLDDQNVNEYTPEIIRNIVIDIRINKLPDVNVIPNSGSFFKNAVISEEKYFELKKSYPELKGFKSNGKYKISTGWLIEKAGLKGTYLYGMRVHDKNALILTNVDASGYEDLKRAREEIIDKVKEKFDIVIRQEVLEI